MVRSSAGSEDIQNIQDSATVRAMAKLRNAPGMRERSPGVWELVVQAGRDPVTGKQPAGEPDFRGNLRDAKKARAELLVEVGKGRHTGTRATVDDLFAEWIIELRRKGRSPNTVYGYELVYRRNIHRRSARSQVTKVTTKMLTDLYGAHQQRGCRRAACTRSTPACLRCSRRRAAGAGATRTRRSGPSRRRSRTSRRSCRHPEEVRALIDAAERGKRPEMARAILVSVAMSKSSLVARKSPRGGE